MANIIEIRNAEVEDIDKIIHIGLHTDELASGTNTNQFYSPKSLKCWINHEDGVALVAKVNDKLAGFFLGYCMVGPKDGYRNCIAVVPKYRNIGIGSQLLERALIIFEQKGCNHVFGLVEEHNLNTIHFLEKHGIKKGKKFYYMDTMLPRD